MTTASLSYPQMQSFYPRRISGCPDVIYPWSIMTVPGHILFLHMLKNVIWVDSLLNFFRHQRKSDQPQINLLAFFKDSCTCRFQPLGTYPDLCDLSKMTEAWLWPWTVLSAHLDTACRSHGCVWIESVMSHFWSPFFLNVISKSNTQWRWSTQWTLGEDWNKESIETQPHLCLPSLSQFSSFLCSAFHWQYRCRSSCWPWCPWQTSTQSLGFPGTVSYFHPHILHFVHTAQDASDQASNSGICLVVQIGKKKSGCIFILLMFYLFSIFKSQLL